MLAPERQTNSPGDRSLNKEMELFTNRPTWSLQGEPEGAPETSFLPGPGWPPSGPAPEELGTGLASPAAPNLKHRSPPPRRGEEGAEGKQLSEEVWKLHSHFMEVIQ